jgi:exopolysaccharide production protein ExoZ
MQKWISIQALRGVAVLGVVAFHLLTIERKYSGGDVLLPDFLLLGQSGVDLFFVISGFVMVNVSKGRFAHNGETIRFLWGRLTRIYPTYWFYFFLTAMVFLVKPGWVNASQGHHADLLLSFLLLPSERLPLVMVAWSLIHELWFYLVFSLLLLLHERWLPMFLVLWALFVIIVNCIFSAVDMSVGNRIIFHPYTLEFIIGASVSLLISNDRYRNFTVRRSFLTTIFVSSIGLPLVYIFNILQNANLLRAIILGCLYGLLVLSVVTLEKAKKSGFLTPLKWIGDCSYTIYLSHLLVLSAIGRFWATVKPVAAGLSDNFIACLIMCVAVMGYGWIGYHLIERPIVGISHRLRRLFFEGSPTL